MGEACRHECVIRTRELESRLAAVEAERDAMTQEAFSRRKEQDRQAKTIEKLSSVGHRLEARLAEVEAERDQNKRYAESHMETAAFHAQERRAAEARLAAVLALCDEQRGISAYMVTVERVRAVAQGEDDPCNT